MAQINQRLAQIASVLSNSQPQAKTGLSNVTVNQSPVHIRVWDHGNQDGGIVQVYVNGRYYTQLTLTTAGATLTLNLAFGQRRLEVVAMNEGSDSPNTASMSISGVVKGKPQQSWKLNKGQRAGMWITVGN